MNFVAFNDLVTVKTLVPVIIALILSSITFIIPGCKINKWLFPIDDTSKNAISFEEARVEFQNEYDRVNPVTAEKATKEWVQYLKCIS